MSLVATLLQNFRAQSELAQHDTVRKVVNGAYQAFLNQSQSPTGIVSDSLRQKAMAAKGSTLEVPVIKNDTGVTVRTTRPLTIADDENESALVTITFATYAYGFTMYPAQHYNNEVDYQRDFNVKMAKAITAFKKSLETAAITAIEAAKTQVLSDLLGGTYTFSSNVAHGALTTQDQILGDLDLLMLGINYDGMLDVIGNPSLMSVMRNRVTEQGTYNSANKSYQLDNKEFYTTNFLSNASLKKATGIVAMKDTLGIVTQVEIDSVLGSRTANGKEWGMEFIPELGIPVGTYYYDDAVNASALHTGTAGLTRTRMEAFDFAFDLAFITPYNTDAATLPNPILKFDIATT